ncbi:MAG: DMT family transporter [Chitinophagales bacterium]
MTASNEKFKAYIFMHLSILLWGFTGVLGRAIQLNEALLVWYRLIIALLSMGLFIGFSAHRFEIARRDASRLIGVGVILVTHWVCFYGSIKYSNVSITLSMLASSSLFTAIMEPLVTRSRFKWMEILLSVIGMAGIWIIFQFETRYVTGILLGLAASFLGCFINIFNRPLVNKYPPVLVSFYEIGAGFILLTILLPVYLHFVPANKLFPTTTDWLLLTILAVACTHVTLVLSLAALRQLSAFTLNLSINLEPVYGIALAFFFYKENRELHPNFYIGGALILLSVILHGLLAWRETRKNALGQLV